MASRSEGVSFSLLPWNKLERLLALTTRRGQRRAYVEVKRGKPENWSHMNDTQTKVNLPSRADAVHDFRELETARRWARQSQKPSANAGRYIFGEGGTDCPWIANAI
jgi:hypothetical protein